MYIKHFRHFIIVKVAGRNGGMLEMMESEELDDLYRCPACGGKIGKELECENCTRVYVRKNGIYIFIDEKTSDIEWEWDSRITSQQYRKELLQNYEKMISPRIKEAQAKWWKAVYPKIASMSGLVVDLATGLGNMLEQVLTRAEARAIATDIDPNVLLSTKNDLDTRIKNRATYIATDLRHLSLRDDSADYVTSFAGVNNIPETSVVVDEFYRILKPGGKAVVMSSFVDRDTQTAELAEDYGFLEAYIHDDFMTLLEDCGFYLVNDVETGRVVWEENEMDIFPIDGDTVYFHVIEIQK